MTAYIRVDNDRYDCKNCPSWIRASYMCPKTAPVYEGYRDNLATTCPILHPFSIEELETPLSHIKYEKIIIRECDQNDSSN